MHGVGADLVGVGVSRLAVDPAEQRTQSAFISRIDEKVDEKRDATARFMEIPDAVKLPQYRTWDGYEEWLPMNTWRVLLEIAMGV